MHLSVALVAYAFRALELLSRCAPITKVFIGITCANKGGPLNPLCAIRIRRGELPCNHNSGLIDYCANRIHCYFTRWLAEPVVLHGPLSVDSRQLSES